MAVLAAALDFYFLSDDMVVLVVLTVRWLHRLCVLLVLPATLPLRHALLNCLLFGASHPDYSFAVGEAMGNSPAMQVAHSAAPRRLS